MSNARKTPIYMCKSNFFSKRNHHRGRSRIWRIKRRTDFLGDLILEVELGIPYCSNRRIKSSCRTRRLPPHISRLPIAFAVATSRRQRQSHVRTQGSRASKTEDRRSRRDDFFGPKYLTLTSLDYRGVHASAHVARLPHTWPGPGSLRIRPQPPCPPSRSLRGSIVRSVLWATLCLFVLNYSLR